MSTHPLAAELKLAHAALRRHQHLGTVIARTACFNVATTAVAALGGIIVARAIGPAMRGEYAAVTSWFGLLLTVGDVGQTAAVCYYVARDPRQARGYLATARTMMLITGTVTLVIGLFLAPVLAHGDPGLASAYRAIFTGSVIEFVGVSYTFALQARSIRSWNLIRLSQPVFYLAGIVVLWSLGLLTLRNIVLTLIATIAIQLCCAYCTCRRIGLAPGRFRPGLVRPLTRYGLTQLTAVAPATVNRYMDQLVLSQAVPPADLGRYAVAVSITVLPMPLVSAIGNVAFPQLAAQRVVSARSRRLAKAAVMASAAIAAAILLPVAAIAYWFIPLIFGQSYRAAVPLLWLLVPGGICLACSQVAGDLLRGIGRPGLVAASEGLAAVFTLILLFALLPLAGVAAAAIASTVAYGVALGAMLQALRRAPLQPTSET